MHQGAEPTRRIVGVVGLPGSGKSTLIESYVQQGFVAFDDVGTFGTWDHNSSIVREAAKTSDIIVSDALFCCETAEACLKWPVCLIIPPAFNGREDFENSVGQTIEWVFFKNDPRQCAANCKLRATHTTRDLHREMYLIGVLSQVYDPPAGARRITRYQLPKT